MYLHLALKKCFRYLDLLIPNNFIDKGEQNQEDEAGCRFLTDVSQMCASHVHLAGCD